MTAPPQPLDLPDVSGLTIGVLGGTGPQGIGLARRWAQAGNRVVLGSRQAEKAQAAADPHAAEGLPMEGSHNADAAATSDVVLVAVPYDGHAALLSSHRDELAGKIVIDCVNPLGFDSHGAFAIRPAAGSAAEEAAGLLPDSRVVAAFHHVSAVLLCDPTVETLDTDVLVLGDDRAATDTVRALAERIPGFRGVYAGRLRNAFQVEALTANLISVNRRYKAHAGLRVTDI